MSTTTDGRSTRWDEHRQRRREELVDATLRAIRQHGAAVGMDDIAAAAATSKTVFYRHFTDRSGLYAAVAARVDALILRDVTTALGSADLGAAGGSPRRLIAAAIDSYLRLVERDPEVYRFVVGAPLLDRPAGGDPAGQVTSHIAELMSEVLASALEAAGRDTAAAVVWGPGLVGMVRAAADQWLTTVDPMPREELAEHLTDLAWGGLSSAWPSTPSPEEPR
ncbi:TetR/AcrR family transcriptional regulator [Knoellia sp. p5-6-4]|uniref:TetR/AcrR family transcriptional regulator n=1 Tax=unclassified Knoellia TaxID=2618719 RepID=UPI0023DB71B5|nr:TetR/AcrR family transcriptional regulator [Knoellia sp. p5-6-4]MDF2143392.1 TetR/AcrR family transcriptional regulator [Knoellia sp. p5-6-4]